MKRLNHQHFALILTASEAAEKKQIQILTNEMAALRHENTKVKSMCSSYNATIKRLESENAKLTKKFSDCNAIIKRLNDELSENTGGNGLNNSTKTNAPEVSFTFTYSNSD